MSGEDKLCIWSISLSYPLVSVGLFSSGIMNGDQGRNFPLAHFRSATEKEISSLRAIFEPAVKKCSIQDLQLWGVYKIY